MTAAINFSSFTSLQAVAQMSAARVVDCLVEGTLIAAFAALVLRTARRWNSGARFAVWFSALVAVAALPLFGVVEWNGAGTSLTTLAQRPEITLPGSWALWLFGAWAGIAALGVARVAVGLWRLCALRRSCVAVDTASLDPELRRTLSSHGLASQSRARPATLCVSDQVSVPTVIGFVNPAVVIPQWLLQELSPSELQQILLHELAHLRRWDDWTNLAQKILKAVLFFHPAAWWIEKQLSLEREMACDEAVVAETANPRAYAECLTHLAEKSFVRRSLALAQAALGRIRQTSLRVAQILDADRPTAPAQSWKPAVLLMAGFAIACSVGISRAPRLVGFDDALPAPTQIATASTAPAISTLTLTPTSSSISSSLTSSRQQRATVVQSKITPHSVKADFQRTQPRAISAKSTPQNSEVARDAGWSEASLDVNDAYFPLPLPIISDLSYLTDFSTDPASVTEAVFVIVEGPVLNSAGSSFTAPAAYRISVWRVVLHSPADNSNTNTIPHKET